MQDIRVVFMGTPTFAVNILDSLVDLVNVVLIVSQPDKIVGRHKNLEATPIKKYGEEKGICVVTPEKIRNDYEKIINANPDLIITCAYGQIIPKVVLDCPKYGCINVHASLLPKYRGGAPIERAIMNGEKETGITIMYMDEGMDSGDIIKTSTIKIEEDDTYDSLSEKLSNLGRKVLIDTLPSIIDKTCLRTKQDTSQVTYAPIIKKEDELIDFNRTTEQVYDQIRALNSKPGGYFLLGEKRIKVYGARKNYVLGNPSKINNIYEDGFSIGTSDGEIIITVLQLEGKKKMSTKDFLNGIDKTSLKECKINERVD